MTNSDFKSTKSMQKLEKLTHFSKSHFQVIFEQAPIGIALVDSVTGHIYDANLRFAEIIGRSLKELFSLNWLSLIHPEDAEKDLKKISSILQKEIKHFSIDNRCILPDGNWRWINITIAPIIGQTPAKHLCMIKDITLCKETDEELQKRTQLLNSIINSSLDAIVQMNLQGNICGWNFQAEKLFGWTSKEAIGNPLHELIIPERHRDSHLKGLQNFSHSGKKQLLNARIETEAIDKNQREFPIELSVSVINADSNQAFFNAFIRDISERKYIEETLIDNESRWRESLLNSPHPIIIYAEDGEVLMLSKKWTEITGYQLSDIPTIEAWVKKAYGVSSDIVLDGIKALHSLNKIAKEGVFEIQTASGEKRLWDFQSYPLSMLPDGRRVELSLAEDITERVKEKESAQLAELIYNHSSEAMMVTKPDGEIITVSPAFTQITGYSADEVIGQNPKILNSGRQDNQFYQQMWHDIDVLGHWQGEIWNRRKNGEVYAEWLSINTIYNEDGTPHRRVALFSDITQLKRSQEKAWKEANFDSLTALPNRGMFQDRLQQEIKKTNRSNEHLALIFIDIDRFKEINDVLGHKVGDLLLKEIAHRLSSCVRDTDTVARLGGDEFGVVLSELTDSSNVERLAQLIQNKINQPCHIHGKELYATASIGITLYPEDAEDIDTLIKNADQAMYAAKNEGRNRYNYFTPFMQKAAEIRMQIAIDLRKALNEKQFHLYYQPIVDLKTTRVYKAEALIRWQHPLHGLISPAVFIPIAEETGMIFEIGDWVFHQAAKQVKIWRQNINPNFQISINKSPVQFHNEPQSHNEWFTYLNNLGLSGESVVVEITEGMLLENDSIVTEQLTEFSRAGIEISLDDFGTGYSSLSYLKKFDIDYLKIDQSFVRNLKAGSDDLVLCEAIIVMAHKLGIKVIAEGIETEEQNQLLTQAGCDYGQGYLFSRPIPSEEFNQLFTNN